MTHDCKHRWHFIHTGNAERHGPLGVYILHCSRCYEARMAQLTGSSE